MCPCELLHAPELLPGYCIEVICCFVSGEWVYLSLPSLLVYHNHLCLMFISFTCITQSKFTVACIKCSVFKREKMSSSHELPQYKLGVLKRLLLEKSTVVIASIIKSFISLYIKIREKPVSM